MWLRFLSLYIFALCCVNFSHQQEVFETTIQYDQYSTAVPSRSKYECDTSDEATNLQIFVSVCKCLALRNSEISIHKQILNESQRGEVEDCLKRVEETEDKLAVLYEIKGLAKTYTQDAELVIDAFKKTDAETLQSLICQKLTAENMINELTLSAKIACEAFRFLRVVVPTVATEIRTKTCTP